MFTFYESLSDGFTRSKALRAENREGLLSFGISFLDDCLGGILKNDLIVLAGSSGGGKSELATHVSMVNAIHGKTVYHFALEAEKDEISNRIAFKRLVNRFYKHHILPEEKPNYLEWIIGRQDHLFEEYEGDVGGEFEAMKNLRVIYRDEQFTIEDFERCLASVKDDADLIVLDHLHYLDFDDENENRAYKRIVKKIRHLALVYKKPIILVAHIRKGDRKNRAIVPDVEDIHGSSDIFKTATRVITLARAGDQLLASGSSFRIPTYIRAAKLRQDGSRMLYCALAVFNIQENAYEENYKIGTLSYDSLEWKECEAKPFWARRAK